MVFCIRSKQLLCVCCALCALSATLSAAASLEQADVAAALGIGMKYVFLTTLYRAHNNCPFAIGRLEEKHGSTHTRFQHIFVWW